MELYKNMVYEWTAVPAPNSVERLLWLDSAVSFVWTISIYNPKAQPLKRERAELEASFKAGDARVLEKDPYNYLVRPEQDIKPSHRDHRDKKWELVGEILQDPFSRLSQFYAHGSLVTSLAKRKKCDKSTLYRLRRCYFQRGQIKNAFLPFYDNCGWRNRLEPKTEANPEPGNKNSETKKLGRPSVLSAATGLPRGVNVTRETLQLFRTGIRLFYETREKRPLTDAYDLTIEKFFNCGYHQNKDGLWVPTLASASERPTYRQFRYWYRKERKPRRSQIARDGETRHNLSGRAKLGDSTQMAFGPGSIFQVDATIGDAYLISSLDRNWIIGRPVIYFVIDVFSRLIVGLSVSLEGPSWLGAMLALENTATNKLAFCAEYGIPIEESDWPASHLPEALMADRGEF
jgi:hypothetical protein